MYIIVTISLLSVWWGMYFIYYLSSDVVEDVPGWIRMAIKCLSNCESLTSSM